MVKGKFDWDGVETYLRKYIGSSYAIDENDEVVYIGKDFPGEYAHSKYSAKALGTIGKAKANLSQAIPELIKTATNIAFRDNINEKHSKNAKYGWYRCTVHFSIPITNDKGIPIGRNYYQGRMIIRWDEDGRKYLSRLSKSCATQNHISSEHKILLQRIIVNGIWYSRLKEALVRLVRVMRRAGGGPAKRSQLFLFDFRYLLIQSIF